MKIHIGSLQRKGKRYYLVLRTGGRQRWQTLKTDKLPLARLRAAKIAPADPNEEASWLEQLVCAGERARVQLSRLRAVRELTWKNLAARCRVSIDSASSADTQRAHEKWLEHLAAQLKKVRTVSTPAEVSASDARSVIESLAGERISAGRMLVYFRRVWRELGLDAGVWPKTLPAGARMKSGEHFRRLSVEEIRKVHDSLMRTSPALADMVLIGYSTGLRLSDVAELELSELFLPFLRVCPNKTRRQKPNPLKIPLTDEAAAVIARLKDAAERSGRRFLFDDAVRHRPSRRLAAAFRRSGVCKMGTGRASFHSLRATFISLMDDAGVPPHVTDAITGHGGGGMHARYSQPSEEALTSFVKKAILPLEMGYASRSSL